MEKNHTVKCPSSSRHVKSKHPGFFLQDTQELQLIRFFKGAVKFLKQDAKKKKKRIPPASPRGAIIWETGSKKGCGNKFSRSESWLPHVLDGKTWRNLDSFEGGGRVCIVLLIFGLGREGSSRRSQLV